MIEFASGFRKSGGCPPVGGADYYCDADDFIPRTGAGGILRTFDFGGESFTGRKGLMRKLAVFSSVSRTRKAVHLTMVTPFGLLANAHSGRVQSEVMLDDLFRD